MPNPKADAEIARLLRPGSRYFNLNPFEVLNIDPDINFEELKKAYRKLSLLVHPDKNPDNGNAQEAFSVVNKAYKMLQDKPQLKFCRDLVAAAHQRYDEKLEEKRTEAAEKGLLKIEEDDDTVYKRGLRAEICKMFADVHKKQEQILEKDAANRKREREEELRRMEELRKQAEFEEAWEEQRDERVNSWRNWDEKRKKRRKKSRKLKGPLRPPPLNTEKR